MTIMKSTCLTIVLIILSAICIQAQYITTIAGNGSLGNVDDFGSNARFNYPSAVAIDASGNIYVADVNNHSIRKITPSGAVTTLAGNGSPGYVDGNGASAQFNSPYGLTVDAAGNIYVADTENHRIRKIDPSGNVTTIAGSGIWGILDGTLSNARFYMPSSVAIDEITGKLYVTDFAGHDVRVIDIATDNVSILAGAGNGVNGQYADGVGTSARFYHPTCIVLGPDGFLYVADEDNHCIRKIDKSNGTVTTFSGLGQTAGSANGTSGSGGTARFNYPRSIAFDAAGNMMVAGYVGLNIRKIDGSGNVTTFAGTGTQGYVDALYASAQFYYPGGIAVNKNSGVIYIADTYNHTIRQTSNIGLPVIFGNVFAEVNNGVLNVEWTSLIETNISIYDVEASKDGKSFEKIGTVISKSKESSIASSNDYNFSLPFNNAMKGMAIILGCIAFGFSKRNRFITFGLLVISISLFAVSCQKSSDTINDATQLFIRIKQIDNNGNMNYSKVIKVVNK
ncbi:MAG: hypothetical protein E6Q95_05195 [Chitinophagaceae bacterium]|nr:MAG: hypothetical protein E6Q95_05195 [Chitinophagaceae bacterium]